MKLKRIIVIIVLACILFVVFNFKNIQKNMYPIKYKEHIEEYSKKYNLDPYLVVSVIKAESDFREDAKSNREAYGLMQIVPDTAKWAAEKMDIENFNVEQLYDPKFNIAMGCWYLDNLNHEFNNTDLVIAAYNGGRGNVQKWLKNNKYSKDGKTLHYIPFKETDEYVKKVKVNYNMYKKLYDSTEGDNLNR